MMTHHNGIAPVELRLLPYKTYDKAAGAADKLGSIAECELHVPVTSEVSDTVVQRVFAGNWSYHVFDLPPQLAAPTAGGLLPGAIDMVSTCCEQRTQIALSPGCMQDATGSPAVAHVLVLRCHPRIALIIAAVSCLQWRALAPIGQFLRLL